MHEDLQFWEKSVFQIAKFIVLCLILCVTLLCAYQLCFTSSSNEMPKVQHYIQEAIIEEQEVENLTNSQIDEVLINFTGKSKDFAETTANISKEKNIKLENIMNFDKRYVLSRDSNIDSFYKGYFSEISLGIMPQIKLSSTEQDTAIEVQASSGQNSSSSSTSSGSSEKKYLINDGTMSVFKEGKKVLEVDPPMVQKINLFLNLSQEGTLKVENVTDKLYDNATIIFDLSNKQIKLKPSFENGKPKYKIEIDLTVLVEEVMEENPQKQFLRRNKEFLTKTAVDKLKETIKQEMQTVIEYCKENQIDLVNLIYL